MSYLEKQAKTIKDFYQDCICQIISKGKHPKKFDEQQKWVPLEEAQKEIGKKQVVIDSLKKMVEVQSQIKREAVDVAVNLEAKIEAVAEIANQMDDLYATNIQNLEGVRASLFHDYAKKLRASISQEPKTEGT